MPTSVGPNTKGEENLVFGYDLGDVSNSYKGQPTTNLVRHSNNVTGSNYGYLDEFDVCDLVKTYNPSLKTPIGTGATLLTQQAVTSFWHGINWFDAEESGQKCLSAFIYPVTPGITNFYLGMIADAGNGVVFNLDTLEITYGNGISNRNAFINPVVGYPGWYRVGANIEGREGGWVASVGIGQYEEYTPSAPFKSFYLCGLQYESGVSDHVTQPLPSLSGTTTSRSATQGLLDLTGNSTIDLSNVSFDSNAQMTFDGSNDYGTISDATLFDFGTGDFSMEAIVRGTDTSNYRTVFYHYYDPGFTYITNITTGTMRVWIGGTVFNGNTNILDGNYHHTTLVRQGDLLSLYVDGELDASSTGWASKSATNTNKGASIGRYIDGSAAYPWNGDIASVKAYNRALTASEVQSNYKAVKGRFNI